MSRLTPNGQTIAFDGNFYGHNRGRLRKKFGQWGLKPVRKSKEFTILAVTDETLKSPTAALERALAEELLILNEKWVNDCVKAGKWVTPKAKHIYKEARSAKKQKEAKKQKDPDVPSPPESRESMTESFSDKGRSGDPSPKTVSGDDARRTVVTGSETEFNNRKIASLEAELGDVKARLGEWETGKRTLNSHVDEIHQSADQQSCLRQCTEWRNRFGGDKSRGPSAQSVWCPEDTGSERDMISGEILLITKYRSFLFVVDPESSMEGYSCLRKGWLLRKADHQLEAMKFTEAGGEVIRARDESTLQNRKMHEFIWVSVATDEDNHICYCLGYFKGENRKQLLLYSRSTLKSAWGSTAVDERINAIRAGLGQATVGSKLHVSNLKKGRVAGKEAQRLLRFT